MKLESYCNAMQSELIGWKAKVYDVVRAFDRLSSGEKTGIQSHIQDLHIIIEDLEKKIDRLNKECPDEWDTEKSFIDDHAAKLKFKWEEVWGVMPGGDYGG